MELEKPSDCYRLGSRIGPKASLERLVVVDVALLVLCVGCLGSWGGICNEQRSHVFLWLSDGIVGVSWLANVVER